MEWLSDKGYFVTEGMRPLMERVLARRPILKA